MYLDRLLGWVLYMAGFYLVNILILWLIMKMFGLL